MNLPKELLLISSSLIFLVMGWVFLNFVKKENELFTLHQLRLSAALKEKEILVKKVGRALNKLSKLTSSGDPHYHQNELREFLEKKNDNKLLHLKWNVIGEKNMPSTIKSKGQIKEMVIHLQFYVCNDSNFWDFLRDLYMFLPGAISLHKFDLWNVQDEQGEERLLSGTCILNWRTLHLPEQEMQS